jgi:Protein of unknown function (DUF3500)
MRHIVHLCFLVFCSSGLVSQSNFDQNVVSEKVFAFLSIINDQDRTTVNLDYEDNSRKNWSNLPMEDVTRKGMMVKDMNDEQRILLHDILRSVLSQQGYQKALFIMQYDEGTNERLKKMFSPIAHRYGRQNYWFTVYGNPKDQQWAFKFEGHHLSLNFTFTPNKVMCTPMFTGINPALTRKGENAGVHVMYDEQELGNQLFLSLSEAQKTKAIQGDHPADADVKTKLGNEVHLREKSGLPFSDLTPDQQTIVEKIMRSWVENLDPILAREYMNKMLSTKNTIIFKWFGTKDISTLHYYSIQSDDFIIEFTHRDGGLDHYHTLWYGLEK